MSVLLADVGGTYIRFAVLQDGQPCHIHKKALDTSRSLSDLLQEYATTKGFESIRSVRIATAANPDQNGVWRLRNNGNWPICEKDLTSDGWTVECLVNDFYASAYGAIHADSDMLVCLKEGAGQDNTGRIVLGAGTGLGMALVMPDGAIQETYGGHTMVTPYNEEHWSILRSLRRILERDTIVFEDVVSGPGLVNLGQAIGLKTSLISPEAIINNPENQKHQDVFRLFHEFLGLYMNQCSISTHGYNGIYLDGGVIRLMHAKNLLKSDIFDDFFSLNSVPVVQNALQSTPVYLVINPFLALYGLAHTGRSAA